MFRKTIRIVIAATLVLSAMTACKTPSTVPGNRRPTPAPVGDLHHVRVIAQTILTTGQIVSLPVRMHSDITIADGEHGIGFPHDWNALTSGAGVPATSMFQAHYRSGSNPTKVTGIAILYAKDVARMADHLQVMLRIFVYKDDQLIHQVDEDSHIWEVISVSQAKSGAIKSIGVTLHWTDPA